jgi:hypothetical protein
MSRARNTAPQSPLSHSHTPQPLPSHSHIPQSLPVTPQSLPVTPQSLPVTPQSLPSHSPVPATQSYPSRSHSLAICQCTQCVYSKSRPWDVVVVVVYLMCCVRCCRVSSFRARLVPARLTWLVLLLARLASPSSAQWAASLWKCLQVGPVLRCITCLSLWSCSRCCPTLLDQQLFHLQCRQHLINSHNQVKFGLIMCC